ncbi:hypothetical protein ES703_91324 [subsurface metagenome]
MKHELWYSVVVRDRHGKVISREHRRARSWLRQWNELIFLKVTQVAMSTTFTDGVSRPQVLKIWDFRLTGAGEGLVIGTGDTAPTINDYAMETLIADGTGVGQMSYQSCTVADSVVSAPHCSFLVARAFINNSGGLITVRESGIYSYCGAAAGTGKVCSIRDVFAVVQGVPNGGAISVDYTLRVTA